MTDVTSRSMPARGSEGRNAIAMAAFVIFVITALAYQNSFSGEFILDDESSVLENPSIRRLTDLGAVISPPPTSTVGGRPIANLTFAINHAFGGFQVRGYHALNFAIHAAAALLLFGIVRRTLVRASGVVSAKGGVNRSAGDALLIAFAVAGLWSVHPVQTGTVTYISQRTEILMGFFYLLTLYAFIRGVERSSRGWFSLSVVACAMGMGSKEVMVTAPLMVLLYDRTFVGGTFRAAWRQRGRIHAALTATWVLLAALMSTGLTKRAVGYGLGVSWWQYALTECDAVLVYLRLAIWPHPLVFDYGPAFTTSMMKAAPYVIIVGAMVATVGMMMRRRPALGFLAAGFFLILAPTSTVVPIATQPIAESRLYLPLAWAVTLGTVGAYAALGRRGLAISAAVGLSFVGLSFQRNQLFRDAAALWTDTLTKRPENARAHSNFGAVLFVRGKTDEAIAHEVRAVELDPKMARAHCNLAAALNQKGRYEAALHHGRLALQLLPGMTDANYQVGNALIHLGRPAEAIPHYEAEARLRPDYADARSNLGSALYMLGRPADSLVHFEAALKLNPDSADARDNLANALAMIGRVDEAVARYRESLRVRPGSVAVQCNLAIVLARAGRFDEAEAEFRAALKLQPDYPPARDGLAQLHEVRGKQSQPRE